MKQTIIRYDSSNPASAVWLVRDPAGIRGEAKSGPLSDAAADATGGKVIVLVPAVDVMLTRVRLPSQQRRHVLRAIPFALEDQLAVEVEGLHFAVGRRDGEGVFPVAIAEKSRMAQWLGALEEAEIRPDGLTPDMLAVPRSEGEWSVLIEAGEARVRTSATGGFAAEAPNLAELLALSLEQAEHKPEAVRLIDCGGEGADGVEEACQPYGITVRREPCSGGSMSVFAKGLGEEGINLLQGDYSRREQLGRVWRPWRTAAGVLLAWLVLQLGMGVQDYLRLGREERELMAGIEQVYRSAFPNSRVVNPHVQMQRELEALRSGGDPSGLSELLATAAPVLQQTQGLELNSMRYNDGLLEFDLTLTDLQSLDRLKQELGEGHGLDVEIATAAAKGNKVESRLQVRRRGV